MEYVSFMILMLLYKDISLAVIFLYNPPSLFIGYLFIITPHLILTLVHTNVYMWREGIKAIWQHHMRITIYVYFFPIQLVTQVAMS